MQILTDSGRGSIQRFSGFDAEEIDALREFDGGSG